VARSIGHRGLISSLKVGFMRKKDRGCVRMGQVRDAKRKFVDRARARFSRRSNHMGPPQRNLGPSPRHEGLARSNVGIS